MALKKLTEESLPATAANPKKAKESLGRNQFIHPGSLPTHYLVTNLDIDVTEDCNLGCLYCFKGDMFARHMSLDVMKRTLDWLLAASGPAPTVNCNFMGGEPTMRFLQIKEFVPWARARGRAQGKMITFSMTTNLTLFTEEMRAFVDQYGFGVLMSIDGCPEVQDSQRPAKNGRKVSEIVEHWAKDMLRTRPHCQARATLTPQSVEFLARSIEYLQGLGFSEIALSGSQYEEWTVEDFDRLREQYELIIDFFLDLSASGKDCILSSFRYYIDKLIHHRAQGEEGKVEFQPQPCGAGKGYMMVDYTGDIWPCHRFDGADTAAGANGQFRLGNIFTGGFKSELQQAFVSFDHRSMHKKSCDTCPVTPSVAATARPRTSRTPARSTPPTTRTALGHRSPTLPRRCSIAACRHAARKHSRD